jgi:hypothetical protein
MVSEEERLLHLHHVLTVPFVTAPQVVKDTQLDQSLFMELLFVSNDF